jgi:hypothetical protein
MIFNDHDVIATDSIKNLRSLALPEMGLQCKQIKIIIIIATKSSQVRTKWEKDQ